MKELLRTIIISHDSEIAQQLETALRPLEEGIRVCRMITGATSTTDLTQAMRSHAPDAVFLSFENAAEARAIVERLEAEAEGIQIIAFHSSCDATILKNSMEAGVREFVTAPFQQEELARACGRVKTRLDRKPPSYTATQQAFAFLPSKPGVGASTVALNVSAAFARRRGNRVILTDFDLNSGMQRFLLKITNQYCVLDALEHADRMDENLWPQMVTSFDRLDVLHAGNVSPNLRIEPSQVRDLIQFMRRNYQTLCFDLSGNLERYSLEIMRECKNVALMCTTEVASLHLAKEKLAFLRTMDLSSQVLVVLNRVNSRSPLSKDHVEEVLGVPVHFSFANDYNAVQDATTAGKRLGPDSTLGRRFDEFATLLSEGHLPTRNSSKRKFLERFVLPATGIVRVDD